MIIHCPKVNKLNLGDSSNLLNTQTGPKLHATFVQLVPTAG